MKAELRPAEALTSTQTLWLLAASIIAYAPLAPQAPLWLAIAAGAVFVWRTLLVVWHQPLPTRWVLSFISLAGALGIFMQYRTLFGQKAGVALLLLLLALKQLEARSRRDGLAIVYLTYFLTLAQFFENQSILIAATMLLAVVANTAALANLTDATARPAALLKLSGTLLLQALPFMLALFVLFPRVSGPLWGLPNDAFSSMTGLSDNMSPGTINHLTQSDAIAFRVKFDGPVPPQTALYWRGPVLSRIEGRTWQPGTLRFNNRLYYEPATSGPLYRYTVTLEAHNRPWLFALEFPLALPPDSAASVDFQIHARAPVRQRQRYTLESRPTVGVFHEYARILDEARQLPTDLNPRTLTRGAEIAAQNPNELARLQALITFMRNQKLTYTLQPPLMSEHVADEFLFDYKRGFCEHFSAAFVILARAAGLSARVVTGYQGGERNPVDDTWVIRQSDAHAWAEVLLADRGWVRVDPTAVSAPTRIEANLAAALPVGEAPAFMLAENLAWLRELRYRWWAVSNAWNQWVIGFNPERQRDLLERLGMRDPDWRKMTSALAILCGLLLLALVGQMLWQRPRRDPVERAWQTFCRRLARRSLVRHDWEGPQDFACRIAARYPRSADEIGRISQLYAGMRYGTMPRHHLAELRRLIAAFHP